MIDYRILGPLEVSADGRVIDIGGPKQRALLAILLLHANESVPRGVLVHELWGERPPPGAQGSLDVYVSRLRKALAAAGNGQAVVTRPGGYCLQLADGQLDAHRFERLIAEGRSALAGNAPEQAAASLREALEAYQAARRTLVGELGLEPGPELQRLEHAILQQDSRWSCPARPRLAARPPR